MTKIPFEARYAFQFILLIISYLWYHLRWSEHQNILQRLDIGISLTFEYSSIKSRIAPFGISFWVPEKNITSLNVVLVFFSSLISCYNLRFSSFSKIKFSFVTSFIGFVLLIVFLQSESANEECLDFHIFFVILSYLISLTPLI